ncbi:MAG: sigma-70 family RNA polymerase sigma factor [Terriglobia bacterium]
MAWPKKTGSCNRGRGCFVIAGVGLDFGRIVEDNQSMVYSIALRFLRDRERAEDLAQDVFLKLYGEMGRIETLAHATWWLRRAICHRSIDEIRRRKLRPRISLDSVPEPKDRARTPDPLLRDHLRRMVEALPEKARMVVVLRYQEELEPAEISEMLSMPVSTVKSHLHRSLALLRGRLAKQEVCP